MRFYWLGLCSIDIWCQKSLHRDTYLFQCAVLKTNQLLCPENGVEHYLIKDRTLLLGWQEMFLVLSTKILMTLFHAHSYGYKSYVILQNVIHGYYTFPSMCHLVMYCTSRSVAISDFQIQTISEFLIYMSDSLQKQRSISKIRWHELCY